MMRTLLAALLVAAIAGCSGGNHGSDAPLSGPYGGTVTLQYSPDAPYALAYFVTSAGELALPAIDTCMTANTAAGPAAYYLDAGPTLTVDDGGGSPLTLTRAGDSSYLYYAAFPAPSAIHADTTYDLIAAGGPEIPATTWAAALRTRHALAVPGNVAVPATGALALSWTPVGADFVTIGFYSGITPPALLTCTVLDDGSFSVPAADLATLPAGSGNGVLFGATVEETRALDGRVVVFDGIAATESTWSK